MAGATSQEALAEQHQADQGHLVEALTIELGLLWAGLKIQNLKASLPPWVTAVTGLVQQYAAASAVTAADYYAQARVAAGVRGAFSPAPAPVEELPARVEDGTAWATRGLWSADVTAEDITAARTQVEGVAQRAVVQAGRDTIINATVRDRRAAGWARFAEPGACAFCAMLATRGPVYHSEESADFEAHDHCRCEPMPVWDGQPWQPDRRVARWQALYTQAAAAQGGTLNNLRKLLADDE